MHANRCGTLSNSDHQENNFHYEKIHFRNSMQMLPSLSSLLKFEIHSLKFEQSLCLTSSSFRIFPGHPTPLRERKSDTIGCQSTFFHTGYCQFFYSILCIPDMQRREEKLPERFLLVSLKVLF